ncbi:MAG TPA: RNA methyltransferase [Chitinophagaceae bacterium]|nr:RNA methyltransferase [Chitinophagaceae bacterium]
MITKNQVKYIQSLGQKKWRDSEHVFIAEGPKLVNELLTAANCKIIQLYALKEWIDQIKPGGEVIEVTIDELQKISQLSTPNQVVAIAKKITWESEAVLEGNISLALDEIQDPGNMGTIIRLADWFGVKNIFCSMNCADSYNPKVVQASMGSITRIRIEYNDLPMWLKKNNGLSVYASVLNGDDVTKMEKINEGILIIGNESKGISDQVLRLANARITIPRRGKAESLNAAVATGIILSHLI